ncbi:MAG: hypothetical protein IPL61_18780 [Myxococcales bacterium]|nr:hypothetical protein [Myxococcales bacterium]
MSKLLGSHARRFALGLVAATACGGDDAPAADAAPDAPIDAALDAPIDAPPNAPPEVAATITAPPTLLAGDRAALAITATDADGDALTYAWTQVTPAAPGTWPDGQAASASAWVSPAIATDTSFTLAVEVSDGVNPPVTRTVTLAVVVPHFTDVQAVFDGAQCTACHGMQGGLTLAASGSYAALVGVTTNNAACATLARVAPGAPDDSALVRKIEGTTCGTRMPLSNPTYFDMYPGLIVRVRSWIAAGALNN